MYSNQKHSCDIKTCCRRVEYSLRVNSEQLTMKNEMSWKISLCTRVFLCCSVWKTTKSTQLRPRLAAPSAYRAQIGKMKSHQLIIHRQRARAHMGNSKIIELSVANRTNVWVIATHRRRPAPAPRNTARGPDWFMIGIYLLNRLLFHSQPGLDNFAQFTILHSRRHAEHKPVIIDVCIIYD